MKVKNKNYKKIGLAPIDFQLRKQLGIDLELDQLDHVAEAVSTMFSKKDDFHDQIFNVRSELIYNLGHCAEVAGKYIINQIVNKDKMRKQSNS